jgi:hypothetical protein
VRFIAPPQDHRDQEKQASVMVEYGKLLEMMVSLSINNQQSALALPRMREGRREEDDDAAGAAAAAAAAADRFSPAFLGHHRDRDIIYPRAYAPAPPIGQEAGPSPSQMHPASVWMPLPPCDLSVPDARPFAEGRSIARGARNEPAVPPAAIIAAARGPRPDGHAHAYMAPPPYLGGTMSVNRPNSFHRGNEEALLLALSEETPETIVSYACHLLESRHGQRLFRLVFNHCNQQLRDGIVATITRDKKSFGSLCTRRFLSNTVLRLSSSFFFVIISANKLTDRLCLFRPDEVVHIISSCAARRSMQLLGDAMLQWMAHNQMRYLLSDSKRLEVLQTFILRSPPDIAQVLSCVINVCPSGTNGSFLIHSSYGRKSSNNGI